MPSNPVSAGLSFAAGLQVAFLKTYELRYRTNDALLTNCFQRGLPSDKRTEKYFYWTDVPRFQRWPYGEGVSTGMFDGVQWSVTNVRFGKKLEWNLDDESDDQTSSLRSHSQGLAERAAMMDERILTQLEGNLTNAELLASVPNAPDGAAAFSATDGNSANRFGYSGGNIVSGGGVTTQQLIIIDYYKALAAFMGFQDTHGEPYWDPSTIERGVTIRFNSANIQVYEEAFKQVRKIRTTTSPGNIGVAESNQVMDASRNVTLWPTQRLTDNDWYIYLDTAPTKAFFRQDREPISTKIYDLGNSDKAGDEDVVGFRMKFRAGYSISLPLGAFKVNNS
jgi:hypothetical protein